MKLLSTSPLMQVPPPPNQLSCCRSRSSREGYEQTKAQLELSADRQTIMSKVNNATYKCGNFQTPSLGELRETVLAALAADPTLLSGESALSSAYGDVSVLIGNHSHCVVQAASQFNCLEFVGPSVIPEEGITGYVSDKTQGPACSIVCGPGTAYRNYFAHVETADGVQEGQTADHQVDNLRGVCEVLGNTPRGRYYNVTGGYTLAEDRGLQAVSKVINGFSPEERDACKAVLRVGVHQDTQVTSTHWGRNQIRDPNQTITEVFCSACSVSYSGNHCDYWEALASLILEATYEATLWAAALHAMAHPDEPNSRVVFLTAVGGGVFGNKMSWVANAIEAAYATVTTAGVALDVRVVSYYPPAEPELQELMERVGSAK